MRSETQKKITEALNAAHDGYIEAAREKMNDGYGDPYAVYFLVKEGIAVQGKARNFERRWGKPEDCSCRGY